MVLSLTQFSWWPHESAVPWLGDDIVRDKPLYQGITITHILATIAQGRAAIK